MRPGHDPPAAPDRRRWRSPARSRPAPAGPTTRPPRTRRSRATPTTYAVSRTADTLAELDARVSVCSACPRLVTWREDVAVEKRASFADQPYWGRPINGWGDPEPSLLIVGLAPAANGGNRTGRIFTGDPSADWLFASLHRTGWASQPTSEHAGDGQRLLDARMVATVRCAPPENKPTADRARHLRAVDRRRARAPARPCAPSSRSAPSAGTAPSARWWRPVPRPRRSGRSSATASSCALGDVTLIGCYHPSPHNTYTGRLTREMTDAVFERARALTD